MAPPPVAAVELGAPLKRARSALTDEADAEEDVPGLARMVAEQRPADAAAARRYRAELTAYLRAAAAAHARWYIDSADIRLDWFHGAYPEGEAAVREGMAALETAYLRLAE